MYYLPERAERYKSYYQCDQRYTNSNICDKTQGKFVRSLKMKMEKL